MNILVNGYEHANGSLGGNVGGSYNTYDMGWKGRVTINGLTKGLSVLRGNVHDAFLEELRLATGATYSA